MTRLRYLLWLILPGLLIVTLMLTNEHVDDVYHAQRVQPFVLMSLAKIVLIAVLAVQHPNPPCGTPAWRLWRWVDPLTILLIAMLGASAIYFVLLWGGNSQEFRAPTWGYDIARQLMWVDGYLLLVVGAELLYRGVRSRLRNRTRDVIRYDIDDGNGR